MIFRGSMFSCLKAEIMVRRTEWLVWRPVIPAAVLIFFMNKPREFFPSGCFLNHISLTGFWMAAKLNGWSGLPISEGRRDKYVLKIRTGQRGPPVVYIFGLKALSGTNSCSPVRVLLPRSVTHSTYSLPSGPSSFLIWKSPSFARRCSSRALQPKWMVFRNQTVRKSDLGEWSPNCFASHSCWICVVVSPIALFGFWPLPEQRSCFLLLAKASLAFENCISVSMLWCLPCSRKKKKRLKLRENEVSASGSNSSAFCLRILTTKCVSKFLSSVGGMSL